MTKLPVNKDKNEIVTEEHSTLDLMDMIADGALSETHLPDLIERDEIINRTKLFLVAQAKTELKRIVKLTKLLDKLEDSYQDRLERELPIMELDDYESAIKTLNKCIDRSNKLIQNIISNDELSSILIVNNQSQVNNHISVEENNTIIESLDSPESRNRVVKTVDNILGQLQAKEKELNNGTTEE